MAQIDFKNKKNKNKNNLYPQLKKEMKFDLFIVL